MFRPRVIPCLLLRNLGLVKTIKFKNPRYIGDPINAVRIFNAKRTDELVFLDILATRENKVPPFELIEKIGDECFMPFTVGGGIRDMESIRRILNSGAEKVVVNSHAIRVPEFIEEVAGRFGSQSLIVSIDVKKRFTGRYEVYSHGGTKSTGLDPIEHAQHMESRGAGELLINSIDRDGSLEGYDIDLIKKISESVQIPTIACGGAGKLADLRAAVRDGGASAAAAGSLFVYHGKKHAVLINYPSKDEMQVLMEEDFQ